MLLDRRFVLPAAFTGLTLFLAGCDQTEATGDDGLADLPEDFADAERISGVPAEILLAIARVETRFQMVEGEEEFPGQEKAYGYMAIREGLIEKGAGLSGFTVDEVKTNPKANIRTAAALMSARANDLGIDRDDLAAWAPVVADYSGIDNVEAVAEYVHYEVYGALERGIAVEGFELDPVVVEPDWPTPTRQLDRSGDGGAIWTPSPNNSSRSGASVDFVIIHTCEGSYSGCWGWLSNGASGVSAHYVVNDSGSEVRQLVDEDRKAWHISANYDCGNNSGVECWRNGGAMNSVSVGIEHAGYSSQGSWDPGLISRSAALSCGITQRHGIVRDIYHIVGHGQLQPWNRTDPGGAWPWTDYRNQIDAECGGGGGAAPGGGGGGGGVAGQFVIDSNNGANDVANYKVEVSGNWWASNNVSGFYNTGYWVAVTNAVSDGADFKFYDGSSQCYKVEGYWTAAGDRPTAVTFIGFDSADSEVGRETVNQRINGSTWNHLGNWQFGPGWNRVMLSRWTTSGQYVVADAVRMTPLGATCP